MLVRIRWLHGTLEPSVAMRQNELPSLLLSACGGAMAMDFLQLLPLGASSSSSVQAGRSSQDAAGASAAPQDEDSTIDDLMRLIEDGPGVGPCRDQDVDELLKSLQPKEGRGTLFWMLDAVSNRLEELSYHCKQLHALNQSLEMENASMRLKLSDIEQALPQRQDFEGQEVNAVATPEVAEVVKPKAPKDVFLRPESDDELPLYECKCPGVFIMGTLQLC
ncbi:hypothetical protein AK812_SmicGene40738 [Symbiodinium microadriaticum]|uniref:Uncharacterized protein n=1 Tax=Symbiodinium microadriaticum TaxID=2951 RepID=A0A1Q9C7X2_SYMMI|nr:hypothetical protein AK812_SmicGene40738 [Symbiodinium microadriaticum]